MGSIYADKTRGGWITQVMVNGKRKQKRFKDRTLADRYVYEIELNEHRRKELEKRGSKNARRFKPESDEVFNVDDIINFYLEMKVIGHHKSYEDHSRFTYAKIKEHLGHIPIEDLTSQVVTKYLYSRQKNDGVTRITLLKEARIIDRAIALHSAHSGWHPLHPIKADIPNTSKSPRDRIIERLTPADIIEILKYLKVHDLEVFYTVILLVETSMRRSEAVKLIPLEVFLDESCIRFEGTRMKNGLPKSVVLTPLAKQVLTKALARGYESVFTFNANTLKNKGSHVSRAFKRAAIKIGRGEVTLHELRKLNISMQRERDIPKDVTACQSGHKSQDVLESYYLKYSVEHRLKYYQESFIEGADELLKDRESEGKPKA